MLTEHGQGADSRVTALLVDDNVFFRRGLRAALQAGGVTVVGEASNGRDGVRLARELRPDVVVIDTDMPVMSGIEATAQIVAALDPPAVLGLTTDDAVAALDVILAGAVSSLDKGAGLERVADVVRSAATGGSVLSAGVTGQLVTRAREVDALRRTRDRQGAGASLSTRECDVLRLVVEGYGNTSIGEELYISSSTVKQHVASIVEKLGVRNRVQAAAEAVRIGLA